MIDKNLKFQTTEIFFINGKQAKNIRVGIGIRDTGSFNAIFPVIEKLVSEGGFDVVIWADENAKSLLNNSGIIFQKSFEDILTSIANTKLDVVLTGVANFPAIEETLMINYQKKGVPVIQLTDLPGNGFKHLEHKKNEVQVYPDYLCEVNEWGKNVELKINPGFPKERIIITGAPALDRFFQEGLFSIKNKVKKKLAIKSPNLIITFISSTANQLPEKALEDFLEVMERLELRDYYLIFRRHPSDNNPQETYNQILEKVHQRLLNDGGLLTDEVVAISDLVVSLGSTVGFEAVCRGVASINYMKEEYVGPNDRISEVTYLPTMFDGSSPTAFNKAELEQILKKVLFNAQFKSQMNLKIKSWQIKKLAAIEVVEVIKKVVLERG